MSTISYIGRKVKLTQEHILKITSYTEGGKNEGIVRSDEDGNTKGAWIIEMHNGQKAVVWGPDNPEAECILLEETNQEALDRLQLQPGDIVRVVGDDNSSGGGRGWSYDMKECKGQPQEVQKLDREDSIVSLWLPNKKINYWYRPQILEVVSRAAGKQQPVQEPAVDNHTILDTAKSLIYGDRQREYGSASENFADIAAGWSTIVHTAVTPEQVCLMMAWLKICRANKDNGNHTDSLVDCAGYMGCIEKIKQGL